MFPTFLITLREVIEASIIVSLILGILGKLNQRPIIKTVWLAILSAIALSFILLYGASILGVEIQSYYEKHEAYFEGFLMFFTTIFVTWTVFFLHDFLSVSRRKLTAKLTKTVIGQERRGVFMLVFVSVFREGFEIVIFLSTIYLTSNPANIIRGFALGTIVGILISILFYRFTRHSDLHRSLHFASILLVIFSAGLLIRGIHEFNEVGLIPEFGTIFLSFIPPATTFVGGVIKSMFGLTDRINIIQIVAYITYLTLIFQKISVKKKLD